MIPNTQETPIHEVQSPPVAIVAPAEEPLPEGCITKNFTLQELLRSQTAARRGISNVPTKQHMDNMVEACKKLYQPLRDALGVPIEITSGYRSLALNRAIGGSTSSAHSVGYAIDVNIPTLGGTRQQAATILKALNENNLAFDQIILEFPSSTDKYAGWVHIGFKNQRGESRKQVLTAVKKGGKTVYLKGFV